MSELLNFSAIGVNFTDASTISDIHILVSKSTHPVNMVLSSQNAEYFHLSAPLLQTIVLLLFTSSIL
jgi:hypothetical protein